jgi:DNA invertase Pin-like site-specific DNA recombinase
MHCTDDGFSGVNFDRPAFNELLSQIDKGKIDTIICKDLSRLGRNYLQVGYFTEILFPQNNVRFIAVNNGVDTANDDNNELTPFINIMNEWYAKDTSRKIRAIFESKMKEGKRCSGSVPYGYIRDPLNKYHLIIDKDAADVVRKIFRLFVSGNHIGRIVTILTSEKILIPSAYNEKYHPDNCRSHSYHDPYAWNSTTVSSILKRREYIGDTVLGKSKGENFKTKLRHSTTEEDRYVFSDTHEAIIDIQTWTQAQNRINSANKRFTYKRIHHSHKLSGFLFCADCGHILTYRSPSLSRQKSGKIYDSDYAFVCGGYRQNSSFHRCSIHYIKASTIERKIMTLILRLKSMLSTDREALEKKISEAVSVIGSERRLTSVKKKTELISRKDKLLALIKKLYEEHAEKLLPEIIFGRLMEEYCLELKSIKKSIKEVEL